MILIFIVLKMDYSEFPKNINHFLIRKNILSNEEDNYILKEKIRLIYNKKK